MVLLGTLDRRFKSPQPYLRVLYKALLATTYFGLFRVGEVTSSKHVIKAVDVHVGVNKNKLLFMLHTSKTHNRGLKPQIIKIAEETAKSQSQRTRYKMETNKVANYCPFQLIQDFVRIRRKVHYEDEQFFIFKDGSPVTLTHFRKLLKSLLLTCKLNPQ